MEMEYRSVICDEELLESARCILREFLVPSHVISDLLSQGVIDQETTRIIRGKEKRNMEDAVDELVNALQAESRKYPESETGQQTSPVFCSLLIALKNNEYETLEGILSGHSEVKDWKVYRQLLDIHLPTIQKINVIDIRLKLISKGLLSSSGPEYDRIESTYKTDGNDMAMLEVISMVWRKKVDWFPRFVSAVEECYEKKEAVHNDILPMIATMRSKIVEEVEALHKEENAKPILMNNTEDTEDVDLAELDASMREFGVTTLNIRGEGEKELMAAPMSWNDMDATERKVVETEVPVYNRTGMQSYVRDAEDGDSIVTDGLDDSRSVVSEVSNEDNTHYTGDSRTHVMDTIQEERPRQTTPPSGKELRLRSYQMELARPALDGKNVIIVAPTGSGKTVVALHVAQEHLQQAAAVYDHKIAFLVPTVALVEQQSKMFREHLPQYKTLSISGSSSAETKVPLQDQIPDKHVTVMTPQIFLDAMKPNPRRMLRTFTMLIFDECHHTTKDHPYNEIMSRYVDLKLDEQMYSLPQVIGLTASVGVGKAKDEKGVLKHILSLAANMDAEKIQTVVENLDDLTRHISKASQGIIEVKGRHQDPFFETVNNMMGEIEKRLKTIPEADYVDEAKEIKKVLSPPSERGHQRYTNWMSVLRAKAIRIYNQVARRTFTSCLQRLDIFHNALILNQDCRTKDAMDYIEEQWKNFDPNYYDHTEKALEELYKENKTRLDQIDDKAYPNPKLIELAKKLRSETVREDTRTIIFVRTRAMTVALKNWMMADPQLQNLKPEYLTGAGASASNAGLTQIQQEDVLKYFKNGEHKVVVATSVAEEGLDVQKCNLVIRYEYVTNEIAMVQARGRGRADGAKYLLITDREANREMVNYIRESMMEEVLRKLNNRASDEIFRKRVIENQKKAKVERELRAIEKKAKENASKKRSNVACTLYCMKCDAFACESENIKKVEGTHHVVVSPDFRERYKFEPLPRPQTFGNGEDPFTMTGKIYCIKCKLDWGVMALYRKAPVPVIKIASFILTDRQNYRKKCKKWKEAPFQMREISDVDLRGFCSAYQTANNDDRDSDDDLDNLLAML